MFTKYFLRVSSRHLKRQNYFYFSEGESQIERKKLEARARNGLKYVKYDKRLNIEYYALIIFFNNFQTAFTFSLTPFFTNIDVKKQQQKISSIQFILIFLNSVEFWMSHMKIIELF